MSPPDMREPRPRQVTRLAEGPTTDTQSNTWTDVEPACEAFVVVVVSPYGQPRRRVYLSLHHATTAVQRAHAKGQSAHMVLCELVPVAGDLEERTA